MEEPRLLHKTQELCLLEELRLLEEPRRLAISRWLLMQTKVL